MPKELDVSVLQILVHKSNHNVLSIPERRKAKENGEKVGTALSFNFHGNTELNYSKIETHLTVSIKTRIDNESNADMLFGYDLYFCVLGIFVANGNSSKQLANTFIRQQAFDILFPYARNHTDVAIKQMDMPRYNMPYVKGIEVIKNLKDNDNPITIIHHAGKELKEETKLKE